MVTEASAFRRDLVSVPIARLPAPLVASASPPLLRDRVVRPLPSHASPDACPRSANMSRIGFRAVGAMLPSVVAWAWLPTPPLAAASSVRCTRVCYSGPAIAGNPQGTAASAAGCGSGPRSTFFRIVGRIKAGAWQRYRPGGRADHRDRDAVPGLRTSASESTLWGDSMRPGDVALRRRGKGGSAWAAGGKRAKLAGGNSEERAPVQEPRWNWDSRAARVE